MNSAADVERAYEACEAITREQAANFYYGIRLLSGERRRAMSAVYAFARRIDDIGDGELPDTERRSLLDEQQRRLGLLAAGSNGEPGDDPVMIALADARTRFPLPMDALDELIEGVRMDVERLTYETFDELVLYCRRVAGGIGRACLSIFGLREGISVDARHATVLADELGVALQLTNILRDVREDAGNGRIYLPREDLRRFGLPAGDPPGSAAGLLGALGRGGGEDGRALDEMVRFEADRAREWFARGMALAPLLDRRSAACLLAMSGIYRRLLERIDAQPRAALAARMSLPAHEKAWVALRGVLGVGA
jgi:15-cis-phytoene synthase